VVEEREKPALNGAGFAHLRQARGSRTELISMRPKKKPARWGRAGFVLLGEEVLL